MKFQNTLQFARNFLPGLFAALISISVTHSAFAGLPAQHPIIVGTSVKPIMMLNMSRDHQLFFKLYDDYSDITSSDGTGPDGTADITYNNNYNYYGYFDSDKCYTYVNSRFEPSGWRTKATKSCDAAADWSGNFLNWSTMTRVDAIRKILYGGYRSTDSAATSASDAGVTVLERAFLPNDAHSFAKFYLPETDVIANLKKVVPDTAATAEGVTICNTTNPASRSKPADADSKALSQNVTEPPLMKVAKGNYALWANNERWQCLWDDEMDGGMRNNNGGKNDNKSGSGMAAIADSPGKSAAGVTPHNFNVRVQVCVAGYIAGTSTAPTDYKKAADNEKCKQYSAGNIKPTGLLQRYGETDQIRFGLITGSYSKNKSGGVLRKPASTFQDEVALDEYNSAGVLTKAGTGKFKTPTYGIVNTLNKLRIFGYNFADGLYNIAPSGNWYNVPANETYSDNCSWFGNINGGQSPNKRASFQNGRCTNWGNPQAEIYLESLRYLAGKSVSDAFKVDGVDKIPGLVTAVWSDPINESLDGNYCAPLNVLQFNSSTTSYDGDELARVADIGLANTGALNVITNDVGTNEGIRGKSYFIGQIASITASDRNQLCTPKTITDLSAVDGLCPEAPRLEGSYQLAGLAYHARKTGLPAKNSDFGRQKVRTFGVALAPAIPKVSVTVGENSFTILPACRNLDTFGAVNSAETAITSKPGNCAIVDFKIVQQYTSEQGGKIYVSWEDMEQGGDYDQDMWGTISYKVEGSELKITTKVFGSSTDDKLGFGYIVSGVTESGFKVHSGIKGFTMAGTGCSGSGCQLADPASTEPYTLGTSVAENLEDPLFYAAKWGGYSREFEEGVASAKGVLVDSIKARNPADSYYFATDPRALEESLENAFKNIAATVGASATVAANSTRLDGETYVYQARFNSEDWSGDILAFEVDKANGSVDTSDPSKAKWRASSTVGRANRAIYTYDGATAAARNLVKLAPTNLDAVPTLKAALKISGDTDFVKANSRFNWLLGSDADESGANLRKRTVILGDIVNADPAFTGAGNLRYRFLPKAHGSNSFQAFADLKRETISADNPKRKWRSLLLVGANDGMMHALDADTGAEVFAYIPRGVYPKLAQLSSIQYNHQFTVDGPISIGDVYLGGDSNGAGGEWRTIAVGTLGAGGRGIYALDITDVLNSSTGTPKIIFDLSAEDADPAYSNDLGYSMSRPMIVPTRDSKWKVIVGNGPNSNSGTSSLILIDPENPGNIEVINTGAQVSTTNKDNGLFGVALLPDGNGVTVAAYGGDLMGNMWKFDLSDTNNNNWAVAYDNKPLVKVVDKSGTPQPITATPTLGVNALKTSTGANGVLLPSTMVYFGTGKYYEATDPIDKQIQSVYAVADIASLIFTSNDDRLAKLEEKEIISETVSGNTIKRTISNDATPTSGTPEVDWATKSGWFIDLQLKNGLAKGERVLGKPLLIFDRLIFSTFIPSTNQCDYGGAGWLMELTGVGDKYIGKSVLGINANTSLDTVILGDLIAVFAGDDLYVMGSGLGTKNMAPPIISKKGNNFGDSGRISWQQLK
jgi:type IV pilus assembly protein PilY1